MSDTDVPARPRQLTLAAGLVIGGSAILLLSVFDALANLNSVDVREQVTTFVTSATGEGLGLTVGEALAFMRVGLMIAGACAAGAVVAGIYVLQRHRPARVALGVLAVPILLTAPLTGGLVGALVAAATAMLWSGPVRDWFDGRPIRQPAERPRRPKPSSPDSASRPPWGAPDERPVSRPDDDQPVQQPPRAPTSSLSTATPSTAPAATQGYGQRVDGAPQASAGAVGLGPVPPATEPTGVPVTVKIACALTWVFAGVVALMYAGVMVFLALSPDRVEEFVLDSPQWGEAGLSEEMILPVIWLGTALFLIWALSACALAWFTWRRHNWARWLLIASAGTALVLGLLALPISILHLLAAILTIAGLLGSRARAWFAQKPGRYPGPPSGQYPGPPPGQYPGQYPGPPPGPPQGDSGQPPARAPRPGGKPPVW